MTVAVNDDNAKANAELDHYLEGYYMQPGEVIRRLQYSFAGDLAAVTAWLGRFVENGAQHLCVRFTGTDDERQMEILAGMRDALS